MSARRLAVAAAAGHDLPVSERIRLAADLHQPLGFGRGNQARPNCAECGFPAPCLTARLLKGEAS